MELLFAKGWSKKNNNQIQYSMQPSACIEMQLLNVMWGEIICIYIQEEVIVNKSKNKNLNKVLKPIWLPFLRGYLTSDFLHKFE